MTDNDNELFGSDTDDPSVDLPPVEDKNYLEDLVGDGKKFKTPEDLAKGKMESDRFIAQLQRELQGLRKELNTRISIEEFMERQNKTPKEPPVTPEPDAGNQSRQVSQEDIQTLVKETLTKEQTKLLQDSNLRAVKQKLTESWGPNFPKILESKTQELEVGKEFLNNLAASNPTAFFALVGVEAKASTPYVSPPTSSVELKSSNRGGNKTFHDFEKMRKENPRQYWTPAVQNEMHRLASQLGEAFYQR